jgi:hypothetical protein
MFMLIIEGAALVVVLGLIAKYWLDHTQSVYRVTHTELGIAAAVLLLLVVPLTAWVGTKLAINSQVSYNENWGGYETGTEWQKTTCYRDGPCKWSYKGDPYQYVWYTDEEECSGSGDNRKCHTVKVRHEETRYHDIPYTSEEWTFVVHTTLGDYVIADRNLPENPNAYRYRAWVSVPGDIPHGIPPFWTGAKQRVDAGVPGPVTARRSYDNYVLASQHTILKRFSGDIDSYAKAGLLPQLSRNPIYNFYYADRVYFVGVKPAGDWQAAINRFDAALGSTLQGDLHLVIVDANKIQDPDNYSSALLAYWLSPKFGKDALSKNGIVVVVGSKDGKSIEWARAGTGMPEGNDEMLLEIKNNLKGVSLDVPSLLGPPSIDGSRHWNYSQSALAKVIWGNHPFTRVHMGSAKDKSSTGYAYLLREIEPTGWQQFWILFVTGIFGCIAWGICIVHGAPGYRSFRS